MAIAVSLAATFPASTSACGACVEDAVAATYDYATIRAAIAKRQQVVFVAIEGGDPARVLRRVAAAARDVRGGVQVATLHTAVSPPAFSFVLAAGQRPEAAISAFGTLVAGEPVRLTIIRVVGSASPGTPRR